jgi:hypothetical protein
MAARLTGNTSEGAMLLGAYLAEQKGNLTALLMYLGLRHGMTPRQIIDLPNNLKEEVPSWQRKSNSERRYDSTSF